MNILAAIDISRATDPVLRTVQRVAKASGAKIWLLHVAEPEPDFIGYGAGPDVVRTQVAREYHDEHKAIQAHAELLRQAGIDATALLIQGPIVETTLKEAERLKAEMLIVGSHGYGAVYDLLVGSISRGILKHSKIPVLVVPVQDD
jgi:nucleotide-binding universal stress UspA family protein